MYVTKIDCDLDFAHFLYTFLSFEVVLAYKKVQRGYHDVFRGHGTLKKQKFVHKLHGTAKKRPHDFAQFLRMPQPLTMFRGYHHVLGGHGNLNKQTFVKKLLENFIKIQRTAVLHGHPRRLDFIN